MKYDGWQVFVVTFGEDAHMNVSELSSRVAWVVVQPTARLMDVLTTSANNKHRHNWKRQVGLPVFKV